MVADEVRSLAVNTQQATESIKTMLTELHSATENAVQSMSTSIHMVTENETASQHVQDALALIIESASSIVDMNTQISAATEEQAVVSDSIQQNIIILNENISSIHERSEGNAKRAGELAMITSQLNNHTKCWST